MTTPSKMDSTMYFHGRWIPVRSLRQNGSFSSWFFRLTANMANDHLRMRRRTQSLETLDAQPSTVELLNTAMADPLKLAELRNDLEHVQRAIVQLPDGYRHVLVNYTMGFSHREIARDLGIREDSSRSQLHKARGKFFAIFSKLRGKKS